MTSILVVCTGNVCRSPIAEGLLRDALVARFGPRAPAVSSAGTMGWTGSPAMPESVEAAAERGVDIGGHLAREITPAMIEEADLVVAMAAEHAQHVSGAGGPAAAAKTFTLKEVVRLLESLPPARSADPDALTERVAQAEVARRDGFEGNAFDQDVVDPLGMPLNSYRAVAWELDEWTTRLVDALYGALATAAGA